MVSTVEGTEDQKKMLEIVNKKETKKPSKYSKLCTIFWEPVTMSECAQKLWAPPIPEDRQRTAKENRKLHCCVSHALSGRGDNAIGQLVG